MDSEKKTRARVEGLLEQRAKVMAEEEIITREFEECGVF
jgi:hypothetical protein